MDIKSVASEILIREKLTEWKIDWWVCPPSECISDIKIIRISELYKDQMICYQFEIVIHEISHCFIKDHNSDFYKKMAELLNRYSFYMDLPSFG